MKRKENWVPVFGYEGLYMVSDLGNVKSLANLKKKKEKILKPGLSSAGYLNVSLTKDKKAKSFGVHRIVAAAFLVGLNETTEANHKDGVKTNNKLDNLEVNTRPENIKHAFATGLNKAPSGATNHKAKFENSMIILIRNRFSLGGVSISSLAREFYVSQSTMSDIVNKKTYSNV